MNQASSNNASQQLPAAPIGDAPSSPPIAELRDIILPDSISSYWLSPGWVLVLVLIAALVAGFFLLWQRHQRTHRYQQDALSLLDQWLATEPEHSPVTPRQLAELSALLKRVAIHRGQRQQLAGLHGRKWADYLRRCAPGVFNEQVLDLITSGEYRAEVTTAINRRELYGQCRIWLKTSKAPTTVPRKERHAAV